MNENIEHIISQYLSGESTAEEEKILFEWINFSKENERMFFESTAIWRMKYEIRNNSSSALANSLGKLNSGIDEYEKENRKRSLRRILGWGGVVAVFISIAFVVTRVSTIGPSSPLITYSNILADSVMTITLEDQTMVWLNHGSSLTVTSDFIQEERLVNLSGSAFFEVKQDSLIPFVVASGNLQVRAFEASFGMSTDYSEDKSETILLDGSVQVENADGEKLAVLYPGQQALLKKDSEMIEINNIDAWKHSLWRFGATSLHNVSIADILNHLEEVYQVKIELDENDRIEDSRYDFSYHKSDDPEDALKNLHSLTGIEAKSFRPHK